MKSLSFIIALFHLHSVWATEPYIDFWTLHEVRQGDNIYKVLKNLEQKGYQDIKKTKPLPKILKHNPQIKDKNVIYPGQEIFFPLDVDHPVGHNQAVVLEDADVLSEDHPVSNRKIASAAQNILPEDLQAALKNAGGKNVQIFYIENYYVQGVKQPRQQRMINALDAEDVNSLEEEIIVDPARRAQIRPMFSYSKVEVLGSGGKSFLTSQENYGLHAEYSHTMTESTRMNYELGWSIQDYNITRGNLAIPYNGDRKQSYFMGDIGMQWRLNSVFSLLPSYSMEQVPYLIVRTGSSEIDRVLLSALNLRTSLRLMPLLGLPFSTQIGAGYVLSGRSHDVSTGKGIRYDVGVTYHRKAFKKPIEISLGYSQMSLERDSVTYNLDDLALSLGLLIEL